MTYMTWTIIYLTGVGMLVIEKMKRNKKKKTRAVLVAKQRVGLPSEPLIKRINPFGLLSE